MAEDVTQKALHSINGVHTSKVDRIKEFADKSPGVLNGVVRVTSSVSYEQDGKSMGETKEVVDVSFKDGRIHADKGPAVVVHNVPYFDGDTPKIGTTALYMKNGELDREDGPAVVAPPDQVVWARQGKLHRENGPAAMIDGKPVFAIDGKTMEPADYGKKQGLGTLGRDWFVDRDTGSIAVGMGTAGARVVTMQDSGKVAEVERAAAAPKVPEPEKLPALSAASDKQREWGEKERDKVIATIRASATPEKAEDVVQKIGKDRELSSAKFWIGTRDMDPSVRALAVINAVERPNDRNRMKPFEQVMGVSR